MRKAKIICTMGPASREEPTLSKLVAAGMDCARLNFSHGIQEDHARAIVAVRNAAEKAGRPIAILLDLQGPKIRVGKVKGGKMVLEEGAEVTIVADKDLPGTPERFGCSYDGLADDVTPGDPVLINDGTVRLEVIKAEKKEVRARVIVGGTVSDHKGINLPGTPVSIPALTDYHGKIAIVATQMLESMIVSPSPTRAEVSDVANAILDGADSVMLSAETATGAHPVAAVTTMAAIIEEVERSARYQALPEATLDRGESTFATAVAKACAAAAGQLGIGTICVYTRTGETARQVAEYRPQARIVAFTASLEAHRRMALYWGVTSRRVAKPFESTDEMIANVAQTLVGAGEAMRGEAVVIASAVPPNRPTFGASMMQIHRL